MGEKLEYYENDHNAGCSDCPYFYGESAGKVICLNPQVTGLERVPTPITLDKNNPCPYQNKSAANTQK
jgi:hypothetical protein